LFSLNARADHAKRGYQCAEIITERSRVALGEKGILQGEDRLVFIKQIKPSATSECIILSVEAAHNLRKFSIQFFDSGS
jgi:hypothetical protein